jgi:hypothetical protein
METPPDCDMPDTSSTDSTVVEGAGRQSAALRKLDESIAGQRKKLEQLKARKQALEARQNTRLKGEERRKDTRRKVLLGAMLLEQMQRDENVQRNLNAQLDAFLVREQDRALFGLPPRVVAQEPNHAPAPQ